MEKAEKKKADCTRRAKRIRERIKKRKTYLDTAWKIGRKSYIDAAFLYANKKERNESQLEISSGQQQTYIEMGTVSIIYT